MRIPFMHTSRVPDLITRSEGSLTFMLSQLGKQKVEAMGEEGPLYDVMATLEEGGAMGVNEIVRETNMSMPKVKAILRRLIAHGYVKKATGD